MLSFARAYLLMVDAGHRFPVVVVRRIREIFRLFCDTLPAVPYLWRLRSRTGGAADHPLPDDEALHACTRSAPRSSTRRPR